jgi:prophage maintenance system killer protein
MGRAARAIGSVSVAYLDVATIIDINRILTAGGVVRDRSVIESAVSRPMSGLADREFYPSIWDKAAALLGGLARSQGFMDGNKRTAWSATMTFLRANGHALSPIADIQAEAFVLSVASDSLDHAKTVEWLRSVGSEVPKTGGEVTGWITDDEQRVVVISHDVRKGSITQMSEQGVVDLPAVFLYLAGISQSEMNAWASAQAVPPPPPSRKLMLVLPDRVAKTLREAIAAARARPYSPPPKQ